MSRKVWSRCWSRLWWWPSSAGVSLGALRLNRFTLIRDGDVLRNSRGLLGKQTATIPVDRVQAVRIVEGFWRMLLGYCSLQVEVAGIGRVNANQRMLFPLVRTDRAESLIRRALPELPWPSPASAGPPGACAPPLSHSAARIRRGFHPADAVPARLVEAGGTSPAAVGLSYSASPGRERRDGGLTTSPWYCGGGGY